MFSAFKTIGEACATPSGEGSHPSAPEIATAGMELVERPPPKDKEEITQQKVRQPTGEPTTARSLDALRDASEKTPPEDFVRLLKLLKENKEGVDVDVAQAMLTP